MGTKITCYFIRDFQVPMAKIEHVFIDITKIQRNVLILRGGEQ